MTSRINDELHPKMRFTRTDDAILSELGIAPLQSSVTDRAHLIAEAEAEARRDAEAYDEFALTVDQPLAYALAVDGRVRTRTEELERLESDEVLKTSLLLGTARGALTDARDN